MSPELGRVEFGGPDLAPRRLRDLLEDHVERARPGSRIDWASYYFRDEALARALMRACDRGVHVRLVLEPRPRRQDANAAVIAMLETHGLKGGLHLRTPIGRKGQAGHLHSKIYAFSDPDIAWIGSFNPSGNSPEDPEVIAEIGDQDRGDNLLLGIRRPRLVEALRAYIDRLVDPPSLPLWLRTSSLRPLRDSDTRLYFFPRALSLVIEPGIALLPTSGSVRASISHLKKGPLTSALAMAARRGADIRLLVHDTERRVSPGAFRKLEQSGADIRRVVHPDGLPMHAKFLLIDYWGQTTAWLGSYNFNDRSRFLNAEVLLSTRDPMVVDQLEERFQRICDRAMAGGERRAGTAKAAP